MYVTEIKKMEFQYSMHERRHAKNDVAALSVRLEGVLTM